VDHDKDNHDDMVQALGFAVTAFLERSVGGGRIVLPHGRSECADVLADRWQRIDLTRVVQTVLLVQGDFIRKGWGCFCRGVYSTVSAFWLKFGSARRIRFDQKLRFFARISRWGSATILRKDRNDLVCRRLNRPGRTSASHDRVTCADYKGRQIAQTTPTYSRVPDLHGSEVPRIE